MSRRFVIVLLSVWAVGCERTQAVERAPNFEQQARAQIQTFQQALQAALQAAIADHGAAGAVSVCSTEAPRITQQASENALRLRRIGTRVRNTKTNRPSPREAVVLSALSAENPAKTLELDGRQTYMQAIFVNQPVCLQCHGQPEQDISEETLAVIRQKYPDDEAVGYALGDLRGAFVVQAP